MPEIKIRECRSVEELDRCVLLQREVFGLPDLEITPRRHLIVSRQAGGWTLGAFVGDRLVGFVHHLAAVKPNNEIFGYSHMMAVVRDYQNQGVGARLKWAQRERALAEGRNFIKWTWEPMKARNAHFNLNRLGVTVDTYADNFYGNDYNEDPTQSEGERPGLQSDRLFANWQLDSERVKALGAGQQFSIKASPVASIAIPAEWTSLVREDIQRARDEQERVRNEFKQAFSQGLICASFERGADRSKYLLFHPGDVQ